MTKVEYQTLYFRRAARVALLLAGLPFVRLVGLTGSVAAGRADRLSDIDFLLVTAPGRLYTVRLAVTLTVHLLGLRRSGRRIAGRICLNRYHTSDDLEVRPHTAYHAEDLARMIPLVDLAHIYPGYQVANRWMVTEWHRPIKPAHHSRPSRSLPISRIPRLFAERLLSGQFGQWLEQTAKHLQFRYRRWNPATQTLQENTVFSDTQLLFHPPKLPSSPS